MGTKRKMTFLFKHFKLFNGGNGMSAGHWHQTPAGRRAARRAKKGGDAIWGMTLGLVLDKPKTRRRKTGGCYIATAVYGSYDCPQVWTLRRYRDYTLSKIWYGRAFIRTYYAISPMLVKWFGKTEWFTNLWKPRLDRMVERLNRDGVDDSPYSDRDW